MPTTNTAADAIQHVDHLADHYAPLVDVSHDAEHGEKITVPDVLHTLARVHELAAGTTMDTPVWDVVTYLADDGGEMWGLVEGADRDRLQRALVYAAGELAALQREATETTMRAIALIRLLDATTKE